MGNLAKGSPLIKKLIFFVSYLTRAEAYYVEAEPVLLALNAEITKTGDTYTVKYEDISYEISANSNIYVTPSGSKVMDLSPVYQEERLYIPVSSFINIFQIPLNFSSTNGTVTGTLGY